MTQAAPDRTQLGHGIITGPEVCILMGVHNGEPHLREQLDSIASQTHPNWSLICSDDASTDKSRDVFDEFCADKPEHRTIWLDGPSKGHAQNFLSLIQHAPESAEFYALSDQDDVWHPSKLSRAVASLLRVNKDTPALYAAPVVVCSEDMKRMSESAHFGREPCFENALVQTIGGGHSMVMNRAARDIASAAAKSAGAIIYHDWWLYQIISGVGGRIIYDPEPMVYYRQHGRNVLGTNLSAKGRLQRLFWLLQGRFRGWNDGQLAALNAARDQLTPDAQATLRNFERARSAPLLQRMIALWRSGVYRQSFMGTVALYIACLLKRL